MKEDSLLVLRGERQQEIRKKIVETEASIVEQRKESHYIEEKV